MADIVHRIGIKDSSPDDVFAALASIDGLSRWWTTNTTGDSRVGGVVAFMFEVDGVPIGGFDMKVLELVPGKLVAWQVVDGPPEWMGTSISFELTT